MEKEYNKIAEDLARRRQLDGYYLAAKNADFEAFAEEDYLIIRDYVDSQLERIILAENPSEETILKIRKKIRGNLIAISKIKPDYRDSKLKQWAIDFISQGGFDKTAENRFNCDDEIEKIFSIYKWDFDLLITNILSLYAKNRNSLSYYDITRIIKKLSFHIKEKKLTKEEKRRIDELFNFISGLNGNIKKEISGLNVSYALCDLHAFDHTLALEHYLRFIADAMRKSMPKMDGKNIGFSMYGIRLLNDSFGKDRLLEILNSIAESSDPKFDGRDVGNIFLGFKKITKTNTSERLLKTFTEKTLKSSPEIKGHQLTNALYGIQSFPPCEATEFLLKVLSELAEKSKPDISGRDFAVGLYGLQTHTNSPASERIIKIITELFKKSKIRFNGKNLSTGLYGLHNFYLSPVTDELILSVAQRMNEIKPTLSEKDIGMALYGIQNLSPSKGTEEFFNAIADCLNYSKPALNDKTIGSALMGLQNMPPSPATEKFLIRFTELVLVSKPKLSIHTITSALHGLINFNFVPYSRKLINYIVDEFKSYKDADLPEIELITLIQSLNLWGVLAPEWLMKKYQKFISDYQAKPNSNELKAIEYIKKLYPFIKIEPNHYISGFECDLYLYGYEVNIEIDGGHHQNKKMRDAKRDKYLESIGVRVFRLNLRNGTFERKLEEILGQL